MSIIAHSKLSSCKKFIRSMEPVIKYNIITQWPQEIGQCREVAILERIKQQSMYGQSAKKSGVVKRWPL